MAPDERASTLGPRAAEAVCAARALLEEEGPEALTMRRVADRVGIRAPSLYKHFRDKRALEHALISEGFVELAEACEPLYDAPDPLGAVASAYRAFALAHPHLYRLMTEEALERDLLVPGVEERSTQVAVTVVGGDRDAARALWAFAHGMVILELNGRFPEDADLEAAWARGLAGFRRARRRS